MPEEHGHSLVCPNPHMAFSLVSMGRRTVVHPSFQGCQFFPTFKRMERRRAAPTPLPQLLILTRSVCVCVCLVPHPAARRLCGDGSSDYTHRGNCLITKKPASCRAILPLLTGRVSWQRHRLLMSCTQYLPLVALATEMPGIEMGSCCMVSKCLISPSCIP